MQRIVSPDGKKNKGSLDNRGATMLMVLIVGAVVMAFCLSLLLVTYSLFAQTARQTTRLQCKLLAQSCEELLREELQQPSSDLMVYLQEQIQSGSWISEGSVTDEETASEETPGTAGVVQLPLHLDTQGETGDYRVSVVLTYSVNTSEDEGGDEDGDDNDDQDHELNGTSVYGSDAGTVRIKAAGSTSPADPPQDEPTVSYSIKSVIRCMRGDGTNRDTQYYEIETTFSSVTF